MLTGARIHSFFLLHVTGHFSCFELRVHLSKKNCIFLVNTPFSKNHGRLLEIVADGEIYGKLIQFRFRLSLLRSTSVLFYPNKNMSS